MRSLHPHKVRDAAVKGSCLFHAFFFLSCLFFSSSSRRLRGIFPGSAFSRDSTGEGQNAVLLMISSCSLMSPSVTPPCFAIASRRARAVVVCEAALHLVATSRYGRRLPGRDVSCCAELCWPCPQESGIKNRSARLTKRHELATALESVRWVGDITFAFQSRRHQAVELGGRGKPCVASSFARDAACSVPYIRAWLQTASILRHLCPLPLPTWLDLTLNSLE